MKLKIFVASAFSIFLLTACTSNVENKTCTRYEDYEWSQNCSIGDGVNEVSNSKTSSNENELGAGGNDFENVNNNTGDVSNHNDNSAGNNLDSDSGANNPNENTSSNNGETNEETDPDVNDGLDQDL